jgi:hypothetical protein
VLRDDCGARTLCEMVNCALGSRKPVLEEQNVYPDLHRCKCFALTAWVRSALLIHEVLRTETLPDCLQYHSSNRVIAQALY